MNGDVTFGQWLKRRRRSLDLTQHELAQRVGYAGDTIRRIEADELRPSRQMAEKLAEQLDLLPEERATFIRFARNEGADIPPLPTRPAGFTSQPPQPPPTNLPLQLTSFIGREQEIDEVKRVLSAHRLVTLTGVGGTGKTRVALQVANELLADVRDGVWFVPLAPIQDPALVISAIAHELGMADTGDLPLMERLARYLRSRQVLLVLDNFEQVAHAASLVVELLAGAPELKVLVTSREALFVYGEHEYAVPPLELPDLAHLPELARLSQYEAVQLFVERAQAIKPDFQLTHDNAPAIAEICTRLDGLPLAIELAAARSRIFTPQALLTHLTIARHRLSLLTRPAQNLPTRHQTLRDAIAWSYDLLDVREQTLFARLAVFSGGFTLEAVEAVCGDRPLTETSGEQSTLDNVLPELMEWVHSAPPLRLQLPTEEVMGLLESLTSKSLVRVVDTASLSRFTMLETVREYALERLAASGEEQPVRWRHAGYYGWLVRATNVRTHPRGLAVLEDEADNVRAALGWCVESSQVLPGLVIGSSFDFWGQHANEGRRWLAALLARALSPSYTVASAWYSMSVLAQFLYDYPAARAALEIYYSLEGYLDRPPHMKSWNLGWNALGEGDFPSAGVLFKQFLTAERAGLNDGVLVAWGELGLGAYYLMINDPAQAELHLQACLTYSRASHRILVVTDTLCKLGYAAQMQGDLRRAAAIFREAIDLAWARNHRRSLVKNLFGVASVALAAGDLTRAARLFGAAEVFSEMTGGVDGDERHLVARNVATLRERLDAATLAQHWTQGRALDWEQAVVYALEQGIEAAPPAL